MPWRKTFDAVQDLVMILNPHLKILQANQAAIRFFNRPARDVVGGQCHKFMHGTDAPPPECPVAKMLVSRGHEEAVIFIPKRQVWIDVVADPISDRAGRLTRVVHVVRDITERRQNEEKRKQAEVQVWESYEKLRRTFDQTINALVVTLGMRDPYTSTHQQRVTILSCAIGQELGLAEDRIEGIRVAGMLHDIGKIYIPSEILSKPAQLTKDEFTLVKTHAQGSYDILKGIDFPWPIADIVIQHHEKTDGSGYPRGLVGEQMRLEGKILAVADVVEAISSHRPYRPSLGIDRALEEIIQGRGLRYDAQVVDACVRLFREKSFKFEK